MMTSGLLNQEGEAIITPFKNSEASSAFNASYEDRDKKDMASTPFATSIHRN